MSVYKFVKGARLFMQGKREDMDFDNVADGNGHHVEQEEEEDGEIRAVHTYRNTEMEGTTSGERWSKSVKKGNIRHRSTRTVRKVTTITRGEQSVTSETVLNYNNENKQSYPTINNNKQNLKFRVVEKERSVEYFNWLVGDLFMPNYLLRPRASILGGGFMN